MVDNNQEGMSQGHSRPFLATAKGNMVVMVREITLLTMRGCVRCFDKGCTQPLAPFACLSAEALSSTFPVAWAHSSEGAPDAPRWETDSYQAQFLPEESQR